MTRNSNTFCIPAAPIRQYAKQSNSSCAGLKSQSFGTEPQRHLELFKVSPGSSIPRQLLSDAAKGVTPDMALQMEQTARGFPLLLTDVTSGVDIAGLLSQWEGQFTLHQQRGASDCTVQFMSLQPAQVGPFPGLVLFAKILPCIFSAETHFKHYGMAWCSAGSSAFDGRGGSGQIPSGPQCGNVSGGKPPRSEQLHLRHTTSHWLLV